MRAGAADVDSGRPHLVPAAGGALIGGCEGAGTGETEVSRQSEGGGGEQGASGEEGRCLHVELGLELKEAVTVKVRKVDLRTCCLESGLKGCLSSSQLLHILLAKNKNSQVHWGYPDHSHGVHGRTLVLPSCVP